jgi:putative effector of murein hydrolase LrgA (UPF0299 family)
MNDLICVWAMFFVPIIVGLALYLRPRSRDGWQ